MGKSPLDRTSKRDTTSHTIALTARSLFRSNGFASTSIDSIADGAGISRRSFFNFYPGKAAVFWADPEGCWSRALPLLDRSFPRGLEWNGVAEQLAAWAASFTDDERTVLREMFAIIDTTPELLSFVPESRRAIIEAASRPLLEHASSPNDRHQRIAAAYSMVSTTHVFLRAWSMNADFEVLAPLTASLGAIASAFRSIAPVAARESA